MAYICSNMAEVSYRKSYPMRNELKVPGEGEKEKQKGAERKPNTVKIRKKKSEKNVS